MAGSGAPRHGLTRIRMRLARLAGIEPSLEAVSTWRALDPAAPEDYRQLAALLVDAWYENGCRRVGLPGGQGAGKTTLGRLLEQAGELSGLRIRVLSLDDFYLTRAERLALAEAVHPLLATRGPPGTHDVDRCRDALVALAGPGDVRVPVFDKGRDDRSGERPVAGGVDVAVLEGWCVGARPVRPEALDKPVNSLEREEDEAGRWRRHANDALAGAYAGLWGELESLAYLKVPDMAAVRRWRLEQEAQLPPARRMSEAALGRFVQHYERVTLSMMGDLPYRADVVVDLDRHHAVSRLSFR